MHISKLCASKASIKTIKLFSPWRI